MSSRDQKIEILINFIESNDFKHCHQTGKIGYENMEDFENIVIKYTIRKEKFPETIRNDLEDILSSTMKEKFPETEIVIAYRSDDLCIIMRGGPIREIIDIFHLY